MHPIETPDKTFHDGDGVSELGTILPAWWLNQVQSELLAVLTAAGIQPDKAKPNQVVEALRKIIDEQAGGKGLPVGAVVGFPRAVTNQEGYLKADGSSFAQATYPDLYRVLGGNKLPNLTRSDIGMTAYFPVGLHAAGELGQFGAQWVGQLVVFLLDGRLLVAHLGFQAFYFACQVADAADLRRGFHAALHGGRQRGLFNAGFLFCYHCFFLSKISAIF